MEHLKPGHQQRVEKLDAQRPMSVVEFLLLDVIPAFNGLDRGCFGARTPNQLFASELCFLLLQMDDAVS